MDLRERFLKVKKENNPRLSDLEYFYLACQQEKYHRNTIRNNFNRLLVPEKDYDPKAKRSILRWIMGQGLWIVLPDELYEKGVSYKF